MKKNIHIKNSWLFLLGVGLLGDISLSAEETNSQVNKSKGAPEGAGQAIVVTASKKEMFIKEAPMTISLIGGDGVEKTSATNVPNMIKSVPGVYLSTSAHQFSSMKIRGEGNTRILILVDGEKISEQKSMDTTPVLVSPQDIERIEVIKGPASVLYGSEAIGGLVNIITKQSAEEGFHGSIGFRGDTATNGFEQYFDLNSRFDDFFARLQYSDQNHSNIEAPNGEVSGTDFHFQSWSTLLGWDFSKAGRLTLKYEDFNGRSGVPSVSAQRGVMNVKTAMNLPQWDREKLSAKVELKNLTDIITKLKISSYYQNTKKDFDNYVWREMMGSVIPRTKTNVVNDLDTFGFDFQSDFQFTDNSYTIFGINLQRENLKSDTTDYLRNMRTNDDASMLTTSVFVQNEWSFLDDWSLNLGGRLSRYKTESNKIKGLAVDDNGSDSNSTFSVSLVNTSLDDWSFRGTVAQGYRYPSLSEMFIGGTGMYVIEGNKELNPETTINYELGARYNKDGFNFDGTVFYTTAKDYISAKPISGSSDIYIYENIDKARSFGLELSASYDYGLNKSITLTPYLSATFLRRRYEEDGSSTYKTDCPQFWGTIGSRAIYKSDKKETYWADLNMRMSDSSKGETNEVAGYAIFNASVGVEFVPEKKLAYFKRFTFSVGVDNLFDTEYGLASTPFFGVADLDYLQAGRNFWMSLKCDF